MDAVKEVVSAAKPKVADSSLAPATGA